MEDKRMAGPLGMREAGRQASSVADNAAAKQGSCEGEGGAQDTRWENRSERRALQGAKG